ncbi:MAG: DUF945 family protein [Polyangiales bacterium]
MRKSALALAGLGIPVASVLGFAAWSGGEVLGALDEQTSKVATLSPAFKVVERKVDRGLFHSTREVAVQLGCVPPGLRDGDAVEPIVLRWRDEIEHGPLPGARRLGVAHVRSSLHLPAKVAEKLAPFLGKEPPLRTETTISLTGALESTFELSRVQFSDPAQGSFTTTPLRGTVRGPAHPGATEARTYVTEIPSWEIDTRGPDGAHGAVHVDRTHYQVTMTRGADEASWVQPMQARGTIGKLELSGSAPAESGLASLRAVFDALAFESESRIEQGLWTNTSKVVTKGKVGDVSLDALELATSMRRLHAATYQRFLSRMIDEALRCDAAPRDPDAFFGESARELTSMLVHDPEYAVDKLAVELGGKRAELSYSLGTKGVTKEDLDLPMLLVLQTKSVLAAKARVHVGLLHELARKVGGAAAGGADPAELVAQVDAAIAEFAGQGYVVREGEYVASAATFEGGALKVNGVPLDLPATLPVPAR